MTPEIKTQIDDAAALQALQRIVDAGAQTAPLMAIVAGIMHDEVEENFAQQGRPRWMGLARSTVEARVNRLAGRKGGTRKDGRVSVSVINRVSGHRILQDTGRLAASIGMSSGARQAVVGTNVAYAAIHNFGGTTRPHTITARNKKALSFGGRLVKRVNHPGSKIPARPFLVLGPSGPGRIVSAANLYLQNVIR